MPPRLIDLIWRSLFRSFCHSLFLICALRTATAAEGPFLRLERLDTSRCAGEGLVTAAVAEIALDGTLRPLAPSALRLMIDGATEPSPPKSSRTFASSSTPLRVSLVLQANLPYATDLPAIVQRAQAFLRALPERAVLSVVVYGEGVQTLGSKLSPRDAAAALERLRPSDSAESPAIEAFRAGLGELGPLDPNQRRLLVLLSDGLDGSSDRDAFRAFGDLARARGAPIHAIAHSATDERGPLLNLGEIAKRSGGTFRWAKAAADVARELDNLGAEISQQLLVDFEVPSRCERAHTISVTHGTLRSNAKDTPKLEGGRGGPPEWLAVGGALVLALAIGVAFAVIRRR